MDPLQIFFDNNTHFALYVMLRENAGVLEIALLDSPLPGSERIWPATSFSCEDDAIAACMHNGQLSYRVFPPPKRALDIEVVAPALTNVPGPTFIITTRPD